jgi:myo-inositol 2-dehydrogenase / D-chiro-inositol 1-dehydrogenase
VPECRMRIAVIGAGRIGELHARTLAGLPAVEEVIIADSDKTRAFELANDLGCVALDYVDDVWAMRPAGVVIASSSRTHPALVHAALEARVGVLCEKPLTLSLKESVEIANRSQTLGLPVMVGFQRRFDASFQALRDQVAQGEFGTTFVLQMRHSDTGPPPTGYLATSPGTMFVDMCIHDYDAVRWIAGCEVEAVSSAGVRLTGIPEFELHDDVDTIVSVLHLENGGLGVVQAFRQSPYGYQATVEVVASDAVGGTSPRPWHASGWMERFADAFREEIKGFVSALAGLENGGGRAEDATKALQIALAAERAFRERRLVRVEEIA